ncbi:MULTISPECIES: DNA cytosine methyltransferase [Vibrio]|uniref:DNA cytosine methyltransferase n=1 Tax=Vibrio TaxID=662 RepID=UPI0005ACE493|nr:MULTISPECIES: DNA (cytosine-5-)-methyltransferase [Vibrio]KIP66816.1 modification methylase [Vibrio alginolyticus]KIP83075.1 modification methylase [Vibrio alginolyticus]MDW1794103.1 DNA (cytosine-5-)-methyltransferase [Vibrio sp. Vb2297]MDW1855920.1 DNA (cytosine-5-)-methyltransferase [Vibrio sp. Vb0974]MDW2049864.1 DNA (cytosine-5-)-methyltransferase [Vibrio sp. 977]
MITAVDLFCGAGGLTHGLVKAGVNVVAGYDIEESCRFAYEHNNSAKFFNKDVVDLSGEELEQHFRNAKVRVLAGCAPCQPFSTYSQGRDVKKDKKWPLLYAFARLIRETEPELVSMENVPDVIKHEVYHDFVQELKEHNYHVWAEKVFCPDYGMPQKRSRHVLLASKLGPIKLIEKTHKPENYRTVRDAIGHRQVPVLYAGKQNRLDPLHICASLSELNMRRMKASVAGGSWKNWPEELLAECHKKSSGKTYTSVYARMKWDEPSPTMTTQCYGFGNGRFGHPSQHRAISLREAAILQTFPKNYKFIPDNTDIKLAQIGKMIGNAVPVDLGKVIGASLLEHVNSIYKEEEG